ncbi:MAG: hypothetical protein ABI680_09985, partial [Chthoniobacteraceae bacterium]
YFASLALVFLLGSALNFASGQAPYYYESHFGETQLPALTAFLAKHHDLPLLLALLPWLGFVGTPFLTRSATEEYWKVDIFILRFLAFALCEMALFLFVTGALMLRFVVLYAMLDDGGGPLELILRLFFWGGVGLVIALAIKRMRQIPGEQAG